MGFKRNNPGCRCCESCIICNSDCGWTTISGSPDLSTPGVVSFFSSTGLVLSDAQATSGIICHYISVQGSGDDNGDQIRLYFKYKDSNNYWYLQATLGTTGTLKLFERVGGVGPTERKSASLARSGGQPVFLRVCYRRGVIVCSEDFSSTTYNYATTSDVDDWLSAGVGVGTVTSGVSFDTFRYEYIYDEEQKPTCDPCAVPEAPADSCAFCDDDPPPFQYKVTITGGSVFDGTYYLTQMPTNPFDGVNGCTWRVPVSFACSTDYCYVRVGDTFIGAFMYRSSAGLSSAQWLDSSMGAGTMNCNATYTIANSYPGGFPCPSSAGTTATIEPVT